MHRRLDPASLPSLRSTSADLNPTGSNVIPKENRKQDSCALAGLRTTFRSSSYPIDAMTRTKAVILSPAKNLLLCLAAFAALACTTEKAPPQDSTRAAAN